MTMCVFIFVGVLVCIYVSHFLCLPLVSVSDCGSFIPPWAALSPMSPGDKENVAFSPDQKFTSN